MQERDVPGPAWSEALRLAEGDVGRTEEWYRHFPLPELGGLTAAQAVDVGRESDVLRLLQMYEFGSLG